MAVISMKRKLEFHIFQIFVPSAMLVIISWLSFWLDIRASAARISLTITTLLTLTTMSNSSRQELPHVNLHIFLLQLFAYLNLFSISCPLHES